MNIIIKGMVIYYVSLMYLLSRKVWAYPLKTKSLIYTTPAIKSFLALLDYMNLIKMHWLLL
jgi:hypothetical protein